MCRREVSGFFNLGVDKVYQKKIEENCGSEFVDRKMQLKE